MSKILFLIGICTLLIACESYNRCETSSDCNESEFCYDSQSMMGGKHCRKAMFPSYKIPAKNRSSLNISFNNTNWLASSTIHCETETKVMGDRLWGYTTCIRCKDLNKSVWEGTIPAGDWVC